MILSRSLKNSLKLPEGALHMVIIQVLENEDSNFIAQASMS
jgi:hypothetical protein